MHTCRCYIRVKYPLPAMANRAAKLRMSEMSVCVRGVGATSRGPARLARLRCLAQSVDPNNFC